MRLLHFLLFPSLFAALVSCDASKSAPKPTVEISAAPATLATPEIRNSVVRINSTQQSWNPWQPWEKNPPSKRRALAAIVGPNQVLTTAEVVADSTYLELESADGTRFAPAKVIVVDYEVNLALVGPADETTGKPFFTNTTPLEIAQPSKIGDSLEIVQIEDNGVPLQTTGTLQSTDVTSSLLPGQNFLTYRIKASMQEAASSFTLPILRANKLAGVLFSYSAKDQLCDVAATDILVRFLAAARNGGYAGFPSLGISIANTEDTSFRKWLKLPDDQGGIYIQRVRPGGAAELAKVQVGDVLMAVDGQAIDRRGFYQHPFYGTMSWGHLIRGEKSTGDVIKLSILRDGQPIELTATLTRENDSQRLVPSHQYDQAPNYLVKGGLIFQELSLPVLLGFGGEWRTRAPLNLLDAFQNPEKSENSLNRVVFLSGSIPTPATIGYENLRYLVVTQVNGKPIVDMKSLIDAFKQNAGKIHSIQLSEEKLTIHLDEATSKAVDAQLLERGLSRLSRSN